MSLWSFGQSVALSQDPYPEFTVIIREPVQMDKDEIVRLTKSLGEGWAYPHVQRVSRLAEHISGTLPYNPDWFWYAAHLHDWGAFPRYRLPGVDHALRSHQVAESEILPGCGLSAEAVAVILEAIERHDYRDPRPVDSSEALLLREADFLDFLGPVGVAREFAWGPNDLAQVIQRIRGRIAGIRGRFTLPLAEEIAGQRILEMKSLLARLEADSEGYL